MRRFLWITLALLLLACGAQAEMLTNNYAVYYDNGDAFMGQTFTDVQAQVLVDGMPAQAGMFTFQLYDAGGSPVGDPIANGADGMIRLSLYIPPVTSEQTATNPVTLAYTLRQVSGTTLAAADTHAAKLTGMAWYLPQTRMKHYGYVFENRVFRNGTLADGKMMLAEALHVISTYGTQNMLLDLTVYAGEKPALAIWADTADGTVIVDGVSVAQDKLADVLSTRLQAVIGGTAADAEALQEMLLRYPVYLQAESTANGWKFTVTAYLPEAAITASVDMAGGPCTVESFAVQLLDGTGTVLDEQSVAAGDSVTFRLGFNLDDVGTQRYTVRQKPLSTRPECLIYDETEHAVAIRVDYTDGDDLAQNVLTVDVQPDTVAFVNRCEESAVPQPPATGDGGEPLLWAAVMLLALTGAALLARRRKA